MVTSAADFGDNQTKQCIFTPTYCKFLKTPGLGQCKSGGLTAKVVD